MEHLSHVTCMDIFKMFYTHDMDQCLHRSRPASYLGVGRASFSSQACEILLPNPMLGNQSIPKCQAWHGNVMFTGPLSSEVRVSSIQDSKVCLVIRLGLVIVFKVSFLL